MEEAYPKLVKVVKSTATKRGRKGEDKSTTWQKTYHVLENASRMTERYVQRYLKSHDALLQASIGMLVLFVIYTIVSLAVNPWPAFNDIQMFFFVALLMYMTSRVVHSEQHQLAQSFLLLLEAIAAVMWVRLVVVLARDARCAWMRDAKPKATTTREHLLSFASGNVDLHNRNTECPQTLYDSLAMEKAIVAFDSIFVIFSFVWLVWTGVVLAFVRTLKSKV